MDAQDRRLLVTSACPSQDFTRTERGLHAVIPSFDIVKAIEAFVKRGNVIP